MKFDILTFINSIPLKSDICNGQLVLAMVTLQEVYFPKPFFPDNDLWNIASYDDGAQICQRDRKNFTYVLYYARNWLFARYRNPHPLCLSLHGSISCFQNIFHFSFPSLGKHIIYKQTKLRACYAFTRICVSLKSAIFSTILVTIFTKMFNCRCRGNRYAYG